MTRCCLLVRITQVAANAVAMAKILKQICATRKRFWYFRGWWWGWLCGNLMAWELSILWYIWKTCKWKQRKCYWGKEPRESKGLCGSRRKVWVLFIGEKTKQHFKGKNNDAINLPLAHQIWWWGLNVNFQSWTQSEIFLVIFGSGSCRPFDFLTLVYRDLAVGFAFWIDLFMDFIYIYCRERKWSEN